MFKCKFFFGRKFMLFWCYPTFTHNATVRFYFAHPINDGIKILTASLKFNHKLWLIFLFLVKSKFFKRRIFGSTSFFIQLSTKSVRISILSHLRQTMTTTTHKPNTKNAFIWSAHFVSYHFGCDFIFVNKNSDQNKKKHKLKMRADKTTHRMFILYVWYQNKTKTPIHKRFYKNFMVYFNSLNVSHLIRSKINRLNYILYIYMWPCCFSCGRNCVYDIFLTALSTLKSYDTIETMNDASIWVLGMSNQ